MRHSIVFSFAISAVICQMYSAHAQDVQIDESALLPDTIDIPEEGLPPLGLEGESADSGVAAILAPREDEVFGTAVEDVFVQPDPADSDGFNYLETLDSSTRITGNEPLLIEDEESQACGTVTISPSLRVYPLTKYLRGSQDMNGDRVNTVVEGEIAVSLGRIFIRGDVSMTPRATGNLTWFRETFNQVVFQVPTPECWIRSVRFSNTGIVWSPEDGGRIFGTSERNDHSFNVYRPQPQTASPWQLLESATCRSDTRGKDLYKVGCSEIRVRSLVVEMEPRGSCDRRMSMPMPANNMRAWNRGFRDLFPLARLSGNNRIDGTVDGRVTSRIESTADRVTFYQQVFLQERGRDRTSYGSATRQLHLAASRDAPGCVFAGVLSPELNGSLSFSNDHNLWRGYEAAGHLEMVWCRTHNPGNDDGRLGCIKFEYDDGRPLVIQLADPPNE